MNEEETAALRALFRAMPEMSDDRMEIVKLAVMAFGMAVHRAAAKRAREDCERVAEATLAVMISELQAAGLTDEVIEAAMPRMNERMAAVFAEIEGQP